ncbi:MAG: hypothetical protein MUC55_03980 [Burkholderiales bacterium]|jgi:hypothetical protein|nr:hypothetical protein [Burkholderiales bacterium]
MPIASNGANEKERTMYNRRIPNDLPEADLARRVKAATAALVVLAMMFIAAGPGADVDVIQPAQAATAQDEGYFPARFPAPEGEPEPHVEAF